MLALAPGAGSGRGMSALASLVEQAVRRKWSVEGVCSLISVPLGVGGGTEDEFLLVPHDEGFMDTVIPRPGCSQTGLFPVSFISSASSAGTDSTGDENLCSGVEPKWVQTQAPVCAGHGDLAQEMKSLCLFPALRTR